MTKELALKQYKNVAAKSSGAVLGAAFLMATSAIGPGFLTQTTVFTEQLSASFGFVILITILIDICAQLNTWRILAVSELRAQDLANKLLPGLVVGKPVQLLIIAGALNGLSDIFFMSSTPTNLLIVPCVALFKGCIFYQHLKNVCCSCSTFQ